MLSMMKNKLNKLSATFPLHLLGQSEEDNLKKFLCRQICQIITRAFLVVWTRHQIKNKLLLIQLQLTLKIKASN